MKGLTKKILFSLIGISLVTGTFFLNEKLDAAGVETPKEMVEIVSKGGDATINRSAQKYSVNAGKTEAMTLVINGNAIIRLAPGSVFEFIAPGQKEIDRNLALKLVSGRMWLNTINSAYSGTIGVSTLNLVIGPGIFDVGYDNKTISVAARRHSVEIVLGGNRLVLPEQRQMQISDSKLQGSAETIAKLRYPKLAKEFPYEEIAKAGDFATLNTEADDKFRRAYEKKIDAEVRSGGSQLGSNKDSIGFKLGDFLKKSNVLLTFDQAKKNKKEVEIALDYFDSGAYAALTGNEKLAEERFSDLKDYAGDFEGDAFWKQQVALRLDRFAHAQPNEKFFAAKSALRDIATKDSLDTLHAAFQDILDIANAGKDEETKGRIVLSLRKLGTLVETNIKKVKNVDDERRVLFEYVVVNDFLDRNPNLLKEEFLKISELYEKADIELIKGKDAADDQRQFLVSEKLKKIQALRALMEKGDAPFQDARRSILLIANQIENLKPTFSDTAVLTYFDDQLTALNPLLSFLRSINSENMRGSFAENYAQFQTDVSQMQQVNEILTTAVGGAQISPFRREELAGMVTNDFADLQASDVKIVLPETEGDPRIKVTNAKIEDKIFKATYDTANKVFSDIEFGGEKIPNSIRLENLRKFLLIKLGKLILPTGETEESLVEGPSQQTIIEKVTRASLISELAKIGIVVEEKYVGLENLNEGIVHVRLATMGEGTDAKMFAFDFERKTNLVSGLKVQTVSGEVLVNETLELRELPTRVNQVYQSALFEKQKVEEMKKFLEENGRNGSAAGKVVPAE